MHTPGRLGMPCVRDESPSFANWSTPLGQHFYLLLHEDSKAWTFALNFRTFFWEHYPHVCTTRQCETKSRTYTNNTHFNTFLINPFAIRELSAFIQPKLVANPVRRCQIITHGCFGDFRHELAVTGLLGGRAKTLRQDFSALYQHASFVKDCHEKSPFNSDSERGDHTFWDTSTVRTHPVDLTPSQPSAFLHECIVKLIMYTCTFVSRLRKEPSRTSTSSRVFRRLISVDLCRRPQAECM